MPIRRYWLMKSEPKVFSIDDLKKAKNKTTCWDGVRNYQARNFLRDQLKIGDGVLYYHSSAESTGIAGEAVVAREGYADDTAFNPKDIHYDPKSDRKKPTWYRVDVKYVRSCIRIITLKRLKEVPRLKEMMVVQRGARLSVQPVSPQEWKVIMHLPEWEGPD